MAVGWWAKSSTTVTPAAMPRNSCRRLTPRNRWLARAITGKGTPMRVAAATTPIRFSRLYAPGSPVSIVPTTVPWLAMRTSERPPTPRRLISKVQSASKPGRA